MKNLLIVLFCLFTGTVMAQLPEIERPVITDKIPKKLPPNLKIVQADLIVDNFTIGRAVPHGTIRGEVYYKASFNIVVRNIGDLDATAFHIAFFVDDYSHPVSGDSWWYRQTQKNEQIEHKDVPDNLRANGYVPLRGARDRNTIVASKLLKNGSLNISGTLLIKKTFVDHYHITAAVDCKKGATRYNKSEGAISEANEYNNTKKVMPRD